MPANYPYTNFQELNLDWILQEVRKVKDFDDRITNLENSDILTDEELEALRSELSDMKAAIAPEFDENTVFTPRTYVWHDGDLYQLSIGHAAGVTWANTVKSQVYVGSELNILYARDNQIASDVDAVEDDVADLKSAVHYEANEGGFDLPLTRTDGTRNTIQFEWTGEECYVHGTASSTTFWDLAGSQTEVPFPLEPGGTYRIKMNGTGVYLQVYKYGNSSSSIITTNTDATFDIPSTDVNGIGIRFRIGSGVTVDETVCPKILSVVKTNEELAVEAVISTNRDSYPYTNQELVFTTSGTSIKFSPQRLMSHFKTADGNIVEKIINNNGAEITVPHDSFAIINFDTGAIEVKTLAQLKVLYNTNYIILFYNSSGNVKGLYEKYSLQQKLFSNADLYFYSIAKYPTFYVNDDYSIDVVIPSLARSNYAILTGASPSVKGGAATNVSEQTVNVPHDKCLVFNSSTNDISVVNSTFAYDKNTTILLYNSHGVPNGTWYRYYLRQLIQENIVGYPDYFATHVDTKAKQINLQLADLTSGDGFVFITDVHYNKNKMHSVGLVEDVCKKTGITSIHLNGDQITKENDKQTALLKINQINNTYRFTGCDTFLTVGNHEWNNPSASDTAEALAAQVNESEMRFAFVNPMRKNVTFDSNTISYYYDNPVSQIRYLVGEVGRGSTIDLDSVKWIATKIADAPSGYGIVVIMHTILTYTTVGDVITPAIQNSTGATFLTNIMDAVRAGTSYTYDGVTYDYSGTNLQMIGAFCGDTHVDLFMRTNGGVPIICTTTDSTDEEGGLSRTTGTINEQAFDVVVINRTTEKIYCNRIGAGSDREYNFSA